MIPITADERSLVAYMAAIDQRRTGEPFWSKLRENGACWEWTGTVHSRGYGWTYDRYAKGNAGAHRVAWKHARGPIPVGLLVCHHCDNKRCVRPDHLFLGTHLDNARDAKAKGRPWGRKPSAQESATYSRIDFNSTTSV